MKVDALKRPLPVKSCIYVCFVQKKTAFESAFQTRSFHIRLVAMLTIQNDAAGSFLVMRFLQLHIAGFKEPVTKELSEPQRDVAR